MSHPRVIGVVVLARNGDRAKFFQDPKTYAPGPTESTPLGEAQAHNLGMYLRNTYLNSDSPSHIQGMRHDLADTRQIHVRVKNGGEGKAVFDSCIALLQGLFPPNPNNKITLANETVVVAPLGGYQYIPVETVEPSNDRSLEPWTDCPAFEKHISKVYSSREFKDVEGDSETFMSKVKDFVFGTPATFQNWYNAYDYISSELTHNKSYAHRLPPTYIEQAQHWVDLHENAIFSDKDMGGIGNIAGRTIMRPILEALQRIVFDDDPLKLMVQEVTYQPMISIFHMTEAVKADPELQGLPNFGSALAIELRGGEEGDSRSFLRFNFKNGSADEDFQPLSIFGHHSDIPLTEFIYRIENAVIPNNRAWERACSSSSFGQLPWVSSSDKRDAGISAICGSIMAAFILLGVFMLSRFIMKRKRRSAYVRLEETEDMEEPRAITSEKTGGYVRTSETLRYM